jgi:hypothetical protein
LLGIPSEFLNSPIDIPTLDIDPLITVSMEQIKTTFAQCKKEKRAALVTYVTAGYPTADETPDIMLAMQAGGAGTFQALAT